MKKKNIISISILLTIYLLFASSCAKSIAYFTDVIKVDSIRSAQLATTGLELTEQNPIKLKVGDKVSIVVSSKNPELTKLFNPSGGGSSNYTLDTTGCIDFPVLGTLKLEGMTRQGVKDMMKEKLISNNLLYDPIVSVEFTNLRFSILGEINRPGNYSIDRDRITILEAISMAGDLGVCGKRDNVLVIRTENGVQKLHKVNLYAYEKLIQSPVYELQQNDIIYISPNKRRAGDSNINGNNLLSTSFWISVCSLLMSVATFLRVR
ncbi:MAG TPA: BexD/CtrA/VexA family polysaccharide export protein [Porphyromonadaceae bacterium]|nr:BexD/CtrA/VexA family polysaccharide export protein [Porphyromonadaceae bacterium]